MHLPLSRQVLKRKKTCRKVLSQAIALWLQINSIIRQRLDADAAATPAEDLMAPVATGFHFDAKEPSRVERLAAAPPREVPPDRIGPGPVVIRQGSAFLSDRTHRLFGMMFPSHFPNGRGGSDEPRATRVSRMQCPRHSLLLSSRRFGEDTVFPLVGFDFMSRPQALNRAPLHCRIGSAERIAGIVGV